MDSTQQTINRALSHHTAGQLPQAEALYRQVLQTEPNNPDALHLLGALGHQMGRHADAVELISRAIAIRPTVAAYYNNLGEALRALGRTEEAFASYRRALDLEPNEANAWSNLSVLLYQRNQTDDAIMAARRALSINPVFPAAQFNLGNALLERDPQGALQAWTACIALDPRFAPAYCNMALLLNRLGRRDEALAAVNKAIELEPRYVDAWANKALILIESGRPADAVDAARGALELDPKSSVALTNLALASNNLGRSSDAIDALLRSIELEPQNYVYHKNVGVGYSKLGRFHDAARHFQQSVSLDPTYAEGHFNLAMATLTLGDFARGWAAYEWRWRFPPFVEANPRNLPSLWTGQDLAGKTIVLASEQGLGDTIQFVRYAKILADKGARCFLCCPESQHSLLKTAPGIDGLFTPNTPPPLCDYQINLLSFPYILGTTLDTIPNDVPYLSAPQDKIDAWRDRLSKDSPGLRVGLCWAGNPKHFNDTFRSMSAEFLSPLASIPNVTFYSLQKRPPEFPPIPAPSFPLIDYTSELHDFSDTAALMMNLDLTITVDTVIAHLAGALARSAWVLLAIGPDFRWLLDREDSPWYPTLKLYRQPAPTDWPSVIARVTADLRALTQSR